MNRSLTHPHRPRHFGALRPMLEQRVGRRQRQARARGAPAAVRAPECRPETLWDLCSIISRPRYAADTHRRSNSQVHRTAVSAGKPVVAAATHGCRP